MAYSQDFLDRIFLNMAREISKLSHCVKTQVGALAVIENRVVITGINGTPPGHENCDHVHGHGFDHAAHRAWADVNEVHAEQNLINFAARHGISIQGCTIYSTLEPCSYCTKNMTTAGTVRIVYGDPYDRWTESERAITREFLKRSGITIHHHDLTTTLP